jgi:uncharacterized lipoprotein YajG
LFGYRDKLEDIAMRPTLSTALTIAALLAMPLLVTACDQKTETKKETTTTTAPAPAAPDTTSTTTTTTTDKKD